MIKVHKSATAAAALFAAGFMLAPTSGSAALLYASFAGNDSGAMGTIDEALEWLGLPVSPLIIKVDYEDDGITEDEREVNTATYPTLSPTGTELVISSDGGEPSTITFTYTQGAGDPAARYGVVKQDGGYNLFYVDAAGTALMSGMPYVVSESLDNCTVTAFNDCVFANPDARISHFSLYDTAGGDGDGDGDVPEPASLGLLSVGLVGLGWAIRRRRRTA